MADIRFEEGSVPKRRNLQNKDSKLTLFLIKNSLGLIRTPKQVIFVELLLIAGLFFVSIFFLNSAAESSRIVSPSSELINATQSVSPLK